MKKVLKEFLPKIFVFVLIFFGAYWAFYLYPRLTTPKALLVTETILSKHYFNLLQNRVALFELTRLNPNSPAIDLEKSNLIGTIKKTNQEGLGAFENKEKIPNIDAQLTQRLPELLGREKEIFERQKALLEKLFAQKTYEEGIKVLKSEESIKILTDETNLLLEYQFWLEKINKLQGEEK